MQISRITIGHCSLEILIIEQIKKEKKREKENVKRAFYVHTQFRWANSITSINNMLWPGEHCGLGRYTHEAQDLASVGQHNLQIKVPKVIHVNIGAEVHVPNCNTTQLWHIQAKQPKQQHTTTNKTYKNICIVKINSISNKHEEHN